MIYHRFAAVSVLKNVNTSYVEVYDFESTL